ncbi:sulfate/molybdate ABC transporter ATP-binding protein [Herbiconiux sp. P15]|uniref:sulfate/molybdate ABC transporter ATP-binding protein n=1 Tax=Herbiconiux liukaitaii TaxID=3342799 RepID=UPI0035BA84BE
MMLEFEARVGERGFDVAFTVAEGETVAVLGANGAGKSTLLALLAGLLRPDSGRAVLDGEVLFDLPAAAGRPPRRWRPAHERAVALLAQEPLLFPHLSVLDNVAFGPRSARGEARRTRSAADEQARHWLTEVDALEFARRRPQQLSGGQAQRIAVARALAADPRLLLLDEPLSALDAEVAPALRRTLRRVLEPRTAVIVTHDILDAFTLADRVIVLEAGRIVDEGPTREVLEHPTSPFAAGLAALDLFLGTVIAADTASSHLSLEVDPPPDTPLTLTVAPTSSTHPAGPPPVGARAAVSVRPALVSVHTSDPGASAGPNVVAGTVLDLEPRGDLVRVRTERIAADLTPAAAAALDLEPGTPVWCTFDPLAAAIYPR